MNKNLRNYGIRGFQCDDYMTNDISRNGITYKIDSTENVIKRLGDELAATEDLIVEGDPFYITRKDYFDNLLWIVTGKGQRDTK